MWKENWIIKKKYSKIQKLFYLNYNCRILWIISTCLAMSMWASSTRKCRLSVDLIKWSICTCFVRFIGKTWITAVRVKLKRKQKHIYTEFGARYRSLKLRYGKYFRRTLFEFHIFRLKYRLQCFVAGFCLSLTLSFSPTPCPSLSLNPQSLCTF